MIGASLKRAQQLTLKPPVSFLKPLVLGFGFWRVVFDVDDLGTFDVRAVVVLVVFVAVTCKSVLKPFSDLFFKLVI